MDREKLRALVLKGLSLRYSFAYDEMAKMFHPQARYRLLGSRLMMPAAGLRIGRQEIVEALKTFDVDFEMRDGTIHDMLIDGNKAVIYWHCTLRNRGTGISAAFDGMDRCVIEDGLVSEYICMLDTFLFAELGESLALQHA